MDDGDEDEDKEGDGDGPAARPAAAALASAAAIWPAAAVSAAGARPAAAGHVYLSRGRGRGRGCGAGGHRVPAAGAVPALPLTDAVRQNIESTFGVGAAEVSTLAHASQWVRGFSALEAKNLTSGTKSLPPWLLPPHLRSRHCRRHLRRCCLGPPGPLLALLPPQPLVAPLPTPPPPPPPLLFGPPSPPPPLLLLRMLPPPRRRVGRPLFLH